MSMEPDFLTLTIGKQKNIALIAHDGKKAELIQWCKDNAETLKKHFLCGTGTTAKMITQREGAGHRHRHDNDDEGVLQSA